MAINLNTQYSSKNVPVSTNYPYGQGMNVSAQGAGDAVPWEAAVFNDWNGYFQAVLSAASIVPSGTPDNAVTSQYLQALRALFLDASSNLSDLDNASTARTNLQLNDNYVQGAENLDSRTVDNLDRLDLSGFYRVDSSTLGTLPRTPPVFATLIVSNHAVDGDATQVLIDSDTNLASRFGVFVRIKSGTNTWGPWLQLQQKISSFRTGFDTSSRSGSLTIMTGQTGGFLLAFTTAGRSQYNTGGPISLTLNAISPVGSQTLRSSAMEYDARRSGCEMTCYASAENITPNSSFKIDWVVGGRIEDLSITYSLLRF